MDEVQVVAGLRMISLDPNVLRPNPWNPNVMDEMTFEKEIRSIQAHGFIDPISVRQVPEGYEIVDGEHRWKAAKHLGLPEVPCTDLGPLSDQTARKLTILYNELRGQSDSLKLAELVVELAKIDPLPELALELPYSSRELEMLTSSLQAFEWGQENANEQSQTQQDAQAILKNERRFMLAGSGSAMTGHVPAPLGDALLEQFYASAKAIGSATLQLVVEDVVARLRRAPPDAAARPQVAAEAPLPTKRALLKPPKEPKPPRTRRGEGADASPPVAGACVPEQAPDASGAPPSSQDAVPGAVKPPRGRGKRVRKDTGKGAAA